MINEYKIIEIPIYYTNQDNHNKKWESKRKSYINHQLTTGATINEANTSFIKCYKYESNWNHHKIIGFIDINYNNKYGDLKYYIYITTNKKNQFNKIFKLKFDKINGPNLHDYVRNKNNKEIIDIINNKINYIHKEIFNNKYYFELTLYNNTINYLNFNKLIFDLDKTV